MRYDRRGIFVGYEDDNDNDIYHYGTPRHSGRYPWGSGENPYQRSANFMARYQQLCNEKDENGKRIFSDVQIAESMGMNTTDLRKYKSLALSEIHAYEFAEYKRLMDKGMSRSAIARRMGIPESTLRSWDKESTQNTYNKTANNAKILEDRVNEVEFVQVGAGNEFYLNNCTGTTMKNALHSLQQKGYQVHNIRIEQLGTGKMTTIPVLTKPGVTVSDVYNNIDKIRMPIDIYVEDGDLKKAKPYVSVDPGRIVINYAETGGTDKDGLIEIRRGVQDLDIGKNHYVQGRILVDGDHYLKGMITYAPDSGPDALPDGVDIRFNTNKHEGTPMINRENKNNSVLKPIKKGQDNIFGANIKPDEELKRAHRTYLDDAGNEQQSAINIVKEEGDVDKWSKQLAAQFASKQPSDLAKNQLKMLYDNDRAELDDISSYTNTMVKAKMLEDFAGRVEHDAVNMKAAALPRQKTKFIMPLTNVGDNEAYVPGYNDGEQVALVRFPHAGLNEIPIVTVNNQNKQAKKILGDAIDAIGISPKTAERLSGADFDGDTVLVLPTDNMKIKNKEQYSGLKNFSTVEAFPGYDGMKEMTKHQKGVEMGVASNLITDMTIQGATSKELERAIKYSMVVIDAEKHGLNWKAAEEQLGIAALKKKYQPEGGPSTLLSRSTSEARDVNERELKRPNQMSSDERKRWLEGENIYRDTGRTRLDYDKTYPKKLMTKAEKDILKSGDKDAIRDLHKKMWDDGRAEAVYKNVFDKPIKRGYLESPDKLTSTGDRNTAQPIERVYANHMEKMFELAKEARAIARNQPEFKHDKEAEKKYADVVAGLKAKVNIAKRNAPREKQAQLMANVEYRAWKDDHPDADNDQKKRQRGLILDKARRAVGAKKLTIGSEENPLTPKEWEAIQAHAVKKTLLNDILTNADMQVVKSYAMPKTKVGMTPAKIARAKSMLNRGYTRKEICEALDISETTLINAIGIENI